MNSGEAAESVVRMSLQGTEVALKITGEAAKNIAALMYAIYRGRNRTKGKTKLEKMLKSGQNLKIFSIRKDELKFFRKVAKRYGILYALLIDKYNLDKDGMIDIVVPASAASRLNRIINRYKFSTVKEESDVKHEDGSPSRSKKSKDDEMVDDILSKPSQKNKKKAVTDEEIMKDLFSNSDDKKNNSKKNNLSDRSLMNKKDLETGTDKKPSVKEELKTIKKEMASKDRNDVENGIKNIINKENGKSNER